MIRSWIAHDTSGYVFSVLSCSTGTIIYFIIKFKSCFNSISALLLARRGPDEERIARSRFGAVGSLSGRLVTPRRATASISA